MKSGLKALWSDKKKRTILTISVLAVCLLLVALFFSVGQQDRDDGKEYYELFEWGTSQDTVFEKLDKLNVDYKYDMENSEIYFNCSNVQGTGLYGTAVMEFGRSGVLKEIRVFAESTQKIYMVSGVNPERATKLQQVTDVIVQSLSSKYEKEKVIGDGDLLFWKNRTWDIMLVPPTASPNYLSFEIRFSKSSV